MAATFNSVRRAVVLATGSVGLLSLHMASGTAPSGIVRCDVRPEKAGFTNRVFGMYENRIRQHSNPEKVFEYFASVVDDSGEAAMTPADFIRAVTPYNPYLGGEVGSQNSKFDSSRRTSRRATPEERAEYTALLRSVVADRRVTEEEMTAVLALKKKLKIDNTTHVQCLEELGMSLLEFDSMVDQHGGPPKSPLYELIDSNGDGLISFGEYVFFITLLSVPLDHFDIAFNLIDSNGDGGIDRHEFARIMELMRGRTEHGKQVRDGKNLLNLGDKQRVKSAGQLARFFGEAGDRRLPAGEFKDFIRRLQSAIHEHEFMTWDSDGSGMLSAFEFGMYLVQYAPSSQTETFVTRAERLKDAKGGVTLEEFMAFQDFLEHLDLMEIALSMATGREDGAVDQDCFRRAAAAALGGPKLAEAATKGKGATPEPSVKLSPLQVQVLFELFDDNRDGMLSTDECLDVLRKRRSRSLDERRDLGIVDALGRVVKCATLVWLHAC